MLPVNGDHQYINEKHFLALNKTLLDLLDNAYNVVVSDVSGILVVSNHRIHTNEKGGTHGIVSYQDMFVPYIIIP